MLQVNNISFSFFKNKPVLKNIKFTLQKGEHLCIMGESGCGKSTLLKTIYGLLDLNQGTIFWNDVQILGPKYHLIPGADSFKYVAQELNLTAFTSVSDNIKKFLSRFYQEEAQRRTDELLEIIEMTEFANTKVEELSGGQKQRVGIARALAKAPELLLLDEPFSQIDNSKKSSLRRNLFSYLKKKNIACIIATHDGNDALSFTDKIIVIKNERIIANDTPKNLYQNTTSKYVASLFDDINEITIDKKKVLLYPHQIKVVPNSELKAVVAKTYFKGYYWLIEVRYNNRPVFLKHSSTIEKDKIISLEFNKNT